MKGVFVVAHSYFPQDTRIRKEVDTLIDHEFSVRIICLKGEGQKFYEKLPGLKIIRLPIRRHRGSGLIVYAFEYLAFFVLSFLTVSFLWIFSTPYPIIQVHTLPDILVFTGIIPKVFGAKLILDMHESSPEFFKERSSNKVFYFIIKFLEKISCKFSDHIITVHYPLKRLLVRNGVPPEKVTIVMNTTSIEISKTYFYPKEDKKLSLVYHGLISDLYDLKTVLKALSLLKNWGVTGIRLNIIGDGPKLSELKSISRKLKIYDMVNFHGYVSNQLLSRILSKCDICTIPLRNTEYMRLALPTKLFECIKYNLPVLITKMETIQYYFPEGLVFVKPEDPVDLAYKIKAILDNPDRFKDLTIQAKNISVNYNWNLMQQRYIRLIRKLLKKGKGYAENN